MYMLILLGRISSLCHKCAVFIKLSNELYLSTNLAYQLSCDVEHSDGTINQYNRCCFLGHVGEVELGASALGSIYYLAIYMLGFGFSLGVQVMVGQYNGKGHYTGTGGTFFQGLVFLCVLAILLSLSSYFFSVSFEIFCALF